MTEAFDVVIVPDFRGEKRNIFEARTLFFLASWIKNAGRARNFPLHLACIGQPPSSVYWLAEKCNASITIHEPMATCANKPPNKLRGLEIQGQTEKVLLLDVDVLVLSDLSSLGSIVQHQSISVAPADRIRVPEQYWPMIYSSLNLPLPQERMATTEVEMRINIKLEHAFQMINKTFPYYNSGVLFLPWKCDLRKIWGEHIRKIDAIFVNVNDEEWKAHKDMDQAGLATAIEYLKAQGVPFVRLPDSFHGRWRHIYRRYLELSEITLYHMTGSFSNLISEEDNYEEVIKAHQKRLLIRFGKVWKRNQLSTMPDLYKCLLPAWKDALKLNNMLKRLYKHHVQEALQYAKKATFYFPGFYSERHNLNFSKSGLLPAVREE